MTKQRPPIHRFEQHTGIVAPMLINNIDTDQIIPSREMKKVSKEGLGDGLFAGQRYLAQDNNDPDKRTLDPEFILNRPPFNDATILLSRNNFGCGSSREHAVWALKEFGFKAVIAESFGNIFRINCLRNSIIPITLKKNEITQIDNHVSLSPSENTLTIDVVKKYVTLSNSECFRFSLETHFQEMLINGLDFISLTMQRKDSIDAFIEQDKAVRPWAYIKVKN